MALLELPTDATLDELAHWYAAHYTEIKQIRSFLYVTTKRLTEHIRETGPVATLDGLLQIIPEGWIWDTDEVKRILPAIVTGGKVTFTSDKQERIERVLTLVEETVPELLEEMKLEWSVDKQAAANAIKQGGTIGAKLLEARKPDGALGVR